MQRRQLLIGGGALAIAGATAGYAELRHVGSMTDYNADVAAMRAKPGQPAAIHDLIRYATLAANGHNTQPWRFRANARGVEILPDFARRTPAVDPDDHHLFVSLGCAAENLSIAANAHGRLGDLIFTTVPDAASFIFGSGPAPEPALCDAIPRRQSTRTIYDGGSVSSAELATLAEAAAVPGVDLVLITDRLRIDRVRDLVIAGNTAQMNDDAFTRELRSWMRFNPATALWTGDGLFTKTSGHPALPDWLGPRMFDLTYSAGSANDGYAKQLRSSAGLAVFVAAQAGPEHWFRTGRACQRFALQATALGMKHAFVNQPVEVATLRPELASLIGCAGRRPDLVMRFGHGSALPFSARRPVGSVLLD